MSSKKGLICEEEEEDESSNNRDQDPLGTMGSKPPQFDTDNIECEYSNQSIILGNTDINLVGSHMQSKTSLIKNESVLYDPDPEAPSIIESDNHYVHRINDPDGPDAIGSFSSKSINTYDESN
jgi:hypothetical protein